MSPGAQPPATAAALTDAERDAFARLLGVCRRLRGPEGCPWDREQTLESMTPYLTEEAAESVDAIARADADHAVTEQYGAWQEKSMYGKKYMRAARVTFVIAPDGTIEHEFEKVNPEGHDQEVLAYLRAGGRAK